MPETTHGLETGDRRAQIELQEMIERGVQGLLDENREHQRRWCDRDALRARLTELESLKVAAGAAVGLEWLLTGGGHWLSIVVAVLPPIPPGW